MKKSRFAKALQCFVLLFSMLLVFSSCSQPAKADEELLKTGFKAPAFSLLDQYGNKHQLSDYQGKNLVIVFYPMDNTPGCTAQLCALRDVYSELQSMNTSVLGSNPADAKSHLSFSEEQNYPFPLLVDDQKQMANDYHVSGSVGYNRRTVYIIDGKGMVRFAERGTPSIETMMAVLNRLNNES